MTDDLDTGAPPASTDDPLAADADAAARPAEPLARPTRRPMIERIGMAGIAAVVAALFGVVAALSFASGEPFLGVMAVIGTLMTAWVGLMTLVRG